MATFKERLQALRDKLKGKPKTDPEYGPANIPKRERIMKKTARNVAVGAAVVLGGAVLVAKGIRKTRQAIGQGSGYFYQAFTGVNPNKRRARLTKAERKEMKAQGITTQRGTRESSTLVRARGTKRIRQAVQSVQTDALGYQNLKADNTPQPKGITAPQEQSIGMDAMLPMNALRDQRTVYLAEPERFKTHRSYSNMDFVGKNSKKGAISWQYDLGEMFR